MTTTAVAVRDLRTGSLADLTTVPMGRHDTVSILGDRLAERINKACVRVYYRSHRLRPEDVLYDYLADGPGPVRITAEVLDKASDNNTEDFAITVQPLAATAFGLKVTSSQSIQEVKECIAEVKPEWPARQQRLLFSGMRLEDNQSLSAYKVGAGSTIHAALDLAGGSLVSPKRFADITNTAAKTTLPFNPLAPTWFNAEPGLNIEGYCCNAKCPAEGKRVIDPWGMATFSLTADRLSCPVCHTLGRPVTCGFYDCEWMYEGRKHAPPALWVISDYETASSCMYTRFGEAGNMVAWDRLRVLARPRGNKTPSGTESCAVCLESLSGRQVATIACGHPICEACWEKLKVASPRPQCPICRQIDLTFQPH